jgi:hypothetical protein
MGGTSNLDLFTLALAQAVALASSSRFLFIHFWATGEDTLSSELCDFETTDVFGMLI